jgi:hypothetical protein
MKVRLLPPRGIGALQCDMSTNEDIRGLNGRDSDTVAQKVKSYIRWMECEYVIILMLSLILVSY